MLSVDTVLEGRYHLQERGPAQDLGTLYHAHDTQRDRPLDVLALSLPGPVEDSVRESLMQVQRRVAALGRPDLVPYEHVGLVDGLLYLVRPRVEGYSLARLLAGAGALKPRAVIDIAIRLCEALAPAHRAGLIHGSLSPYCLFLLEGAGEGNEPTLEVVVTDFGLLPALRPASTAPGQPWARGPYLTPEQAAGQRMQPASDVYVLGSLIYLMLTGRPPFRAGEEEVLAAQHLHQDPPSLQILAPGVSDELAQVVHQCLAKEPAARYRYAGQLAHVLRAQFAPQPPGQPSRPGAEREQLAVGAPADQPMSPMSRPAGGRDRAEAGEQLVVPPPPRRRPIQREYELVEDAAWVEEPEGIDWLMMGLLALAIIAVLGLIPLWRSVYRRYSAPPPIPTPAAMALPAPELEDSALFWYNPGSAGSALVRTGPRPIRARGEFLVWESSLRAGRPKYCKLELERWLAFWGL